MKATEQKVLRFIQENELLASGDKVLIALSGGPDSVFLLHFLNKFKKKFKIKLGAAHINHRLRGKNSERDESFCNAICNELSIPFYLLRKDIKSYSKKNKLSLETAGRKIRYDFFEKVLKKDRYNKILTAHNADDNAETVLLNLIKGTGIKGVAGIPVRRNNIVRPILSLAKKEILDYLEENKFEYRVDESNLSNDFERNFLRNEIIPLIQKNLNPSFSSTAINTSLNLQRLNLELTERVSEIKSILKIRMNTSVSIPIEFIKKESQFIISFAIKEIIEENFSVKLESNDLKKIFLLVKKQSGKSEELSNKLIALNERAYIKIKRKSQSVNYDEKKLIIGSEVKIDGKKLSIIDVKRNEVKIYKSNITEFISADGLSSKFIVRHWKSGDKFFPLGMKGSKKISDYLNDIKIDSSTKKEQWILENNGRIVWVIGRRLDERFKVTSNTKKVLKLCLK
ncbi:MAG: tRNA lysidine(34) synthetase TilS [Ignavibacterium sp.]|jgi:tRNA(Ile)-lysidine synthase|nr:tRNA lysidine(34) synthetase TilS [Ignavibacterium sp.]